MCSVLTLQARIVHLRHMVDVPLRGRAYSKPRLALDRLVRASARSISASLRLQQPTLTLTDRFQVPNAFPEARL